MKDLAIGKRIIVIGSPGSGKSTFARQLAEKTGLKLIHLDKEYWHPGWIETPREEWTKKQEELIAKDEWIIDGNYGGTMEIRLSKADTVVFFNLDRFVCIFSYLKRVATNIGKKRPDMPDSCPEKIDIEFMKYIWSFPKTSGLKTTERLKNCLNKSVIVFKKRSEANLFLKKIDKIVL